MTTKLTSLAVVVGVVGSCGDEAGIAIDPIDDSALWMAQQYANSRNKAAGNSNYSVWVGKVVF